MALNVARSANMDESVERLMGLAIFGERVAAQTYASMAKIKPEFSALLLKFARMEGQHATWFAAGCRDNNITPDETFALGELGYLKSQVEAYRDAGEFDSLAVLQGFIVESLAIATYGPFLEIAHKYPGTEDKFRQALADERYHVSWVIRYLRLRFFDAEDDLTTLAERVNVQGVDCVGGTMMNIADYLSCIGLSGVDCAAAMIDEYTQLLEAVGVENKKATRSVVSVFMPLTRKYRRGERTK